MGRLEGSCYLGEDRVPKGAAFRGSVGPVHRGVSGLDGCVFCQVQVST